MEEKNVQRTMQEFQGLAVTSGKVAGPACLYSGEHRRPADTGRLTDEEVTAELLRFEKALKDCSEELKSIAGTVATTVGKTEAEIFLTQKHIMNDSTIVRQIRSGISETRKNAEYVIFDVYSRYEEKFAAMDNEYLRERRTDIGEIRRRLLNHMQQTAPRFICEGQEFCTRGANRIIVAEELTADMMVRMNFEKVHGLVTEHGGISSHAAIIARSLGIPAVSGIRDLMSHVQCGDTILLDGDRGKVYINPDDEFVRKIIPPVTQDDTAQLSALVTPEGMEIMANASSIDDVKLAQQNHADGIGLFRTEMLFLKAERLLDENEQYEYYLQTVREMPGKPITFRLLDVGGDKPLPFLRIKKESNPYLGWRGARFLLGNPDIFATQVKALVRLSKEARIRLLFPMVVDATQMQALITFVKDVLVHVDALTENIELGAMFEVPSACIQARSIFKIADFGSIGSNDLIQYLFAVDRNNEQVSDDYDPLHPVLWNVLSDLVAAARENDTALSICGEMAGREGICARLLDIGLRSLSVSSRLIPSVRQEMVRYVLKNKIEGV
jgi:phosphoenolpyruvate-protein phosphotransferase (PTS system enzyme I)